MAADDREMVIEDGPWNGLVDSIAPTAKQPGKYLEGKNIYPLDPGIGDGVVGRPGVVQAGDILGSEGRRRGQGTFQFTKKNGTEHSIQITGGYFYTFNHTTQVWTEVLTNAQLATAGITLDQTAKLSFLTFSDSVIISDGINRAWDWDGTTGGGLRVLTNMPIAYGQLTNYYARVFLISAAEPTKTYWSATNDATTGYAALGNVWDITQTDPNRLYVILGTNDSLYAVRARSGTALGGVPSANFSSSATRDALSDSQGTMSPFAVTLQDVNLVVLDADMHPQYLRPGGAGFTPLWTPFRETLKDLPKTPEMLYKCMSVLYSPATLLLIAVPGESQTECTMMLVYDVKGAVPVPVAVWDGWEMTSLAMLKNATGTPYLFHSDTTGRVYRHGNPEDATPWDDFLASGTVAIGHVLEPQALGYSTKREKVFDRLDLAVRAITDQQLVLTMLTSRGQVNAAQTITAGSGYPGYDTGLYDTVLYDGATSLSTQEAHASAGVDELARWIKPRITHQVLGERFGIIALSVTGYAEDDDPPVP